MKEKIKNFLLKKRIKILKSKKGFSLLEVLIAVAIIGIISAIAIPQFADQRKNAARVASDTSASNVIKAFSNCLVLQGFSSCNTLSKIGIACPAGSNCTQHPGTGVFCVDLKRGTAQNKDDFNICVEMQSDGGALRTYGGALLSDEGSFCHLDIETDPTPGSTACTRTDGLTDITATPLKRCTDPAQDCVGAGSLNDAGTVGGNCVVKTARTCKPTTTDGLCVSGGRCS